MTPRYEDFEWTTEERLRDLAAAETPWRYYLDTAVRIETRDTVGTVTPVGDGVGGDEPPLGALHVITAVQPDPHQNDAERMALLDMELRLAGVTYVAATGSSFDGAHSEPSRAVFGLDDGAARRWGVRFGQVAVFAWRGPSWALLACATDRHDDRPWKWTPG